MSQILCSTGALIGRANGRDYHLLSGFRQKLCCDGFEFMMYSSWYDEKDKIIEFLRKEDFPIPVMHCEKHIGEKISMGGSENQSEAFWLFRINCQIAKEIGAKKLVMHLWDGMTSDGHFENNLTAYPALRKIADEYGINLLIENVVCLYENPMERWCELAANFPDVCFVFDTKMAAFHEEEEWLYPKEYEWLWKNGHIRHYHVNDYGGGYKDWEKLKTLPIGMGHFDFSKFFDFIHYIRYDDTFTVEATAFNQKGEVDFDMLNKCFGQIRNFISPIIQ